MNHASRILFLAGLSMSIGIEAGEPVSIAANEKHWFDDGTVVGCSVACSAQQEADGSIRMKVDPAISNPEISVISTRAQAIVKMDSPYGVKAYSIPIGQTANFLAGNEISNGRNIATPVSLPPTTTMVAPKVTTHAVAANESVKIGNSASEISCTGGCTVETWTAFGQVFVKIVLASLSTEYSVMAAEVLAIGIAISPDVLATIQPGPNKDQITSVTKLDMILGKGGEVTWNSWKGYLEASLNGKDNIINGSTFSCIVGRCKLEMKFDSTTRQLQAKTTDSDEMRIKAATGGVMLNETLVLNAGESGGFRNTNPFKNTVTQAQTPVQNEATTGSSDTKPVQVAIGDTSGSTAGAWLGVGDLVAGEEVIAAFGTNPDATEGFTVLTTTNDLNASGQPAALGGLGPLGAWPAMVYSIAEYPTMGALTSHTLSGTGALTAFNQLEGGSSTNSGSTTSATVCARSACSQPSVVRWGTWTSGTATVGTGSPLTAASPLHYLIGSATASSVIDARTGTVTFSHAGGTTPTGMDGTVYSATVGNLSVNFSTPGATLSLFRVTPVSGPGGTTYEFTNTPLALNTVPIGASSFKGIQTTSAQSGTNNGRLEVNGLFLGASGNHVGAAFVVRQSTDTNVKINSVQSFKE